METKKITCPWCCKDLKSVSEVKMHIMSSCEFNPEIFDLRELNEKIIEYNKAIGNEC
jgi:hypothetical protein